MEKNCETCSKKKLYAGRNVCKVLTEIIKNNCWAWTDRAEVLQKDYAGRYKLVFWQDMDCNTFPGPAPRVPGYYKGVY